MGTIDGTVFISLVVVLFCYFKKRKRKKSHSDSIPLIGVLIISLLSSSFLGCLISLWIGHFIPQKSVLVKAEVLDPIMIGGKEKFLIKDGDNFYFYFTKDKQRTVKKVLTLSGGDITYEKGVRLTKEFKKVFENEKLNWFFLRAFNSTQVILSSKEDIF